MKKEIILGISLRRFGTILTAFNNRLQAEDPNLPLACDILADHRHVFEIPADVGIIHAFLYPIQGASPIWAEEPCLHLESVATQGVRTCLRVNMDEDSEVAALWWKELKTEMRNLGRVEAQQLHKTKEKEQESQEINLAEIDQKIDRLKINKAYKDIIKLSNRGFSSSEIVRKVGKKPGTVNNIIQKMRAKYGEDIVNLRRFPDDKK